jgi:hypothetical protein
MFPSVVAVVVHRVIRTEVVPTRGAAQSHAFPLITSVLNDPVPVTGTVTPVDRTADSTTCNVPDTVDPNWLMTKSNG